MKTFKQYLNEDTEEDKKWAKYWRQNDDYVKDLEYIIYDIEEHFNLLKNRIAYDGRVIEVTKKLEKSLKEAIALTKKFKDQI